MDFLHDEATGQESSRYHSPSGQSEAPTAEVRGQPRVRWLRQGGGRQGRVQDAPDHEEVGDEATVDRRAARARRSWAVVESPSLDSPAVSLREALMPVRWQGPRHPTALPVPQPSRDGLSETTLGEVVQQTRRTVQLGRPCRIVQRTSWGGLLPSKAPRPTHVGQAPPREPLRAHAGAGWSRRCRGPR